MNDDEILDRLRAVAQTSRPSETALLLSSICPEGLTQGTLVTYFKRAFPNVPLRVLLDVGVWHRVSSGSMSDEEFDNLLAPFIDRLVDALLPVHGTDRVLNSLWERLGLGVSDVVLSGVDWAIPAVEALAARSTSVVLKSDGEREIEPWTIVISGGVMGENVFRTDANSATQALLLGLRAISIEGDL